MHLHDDDVVVMDTHAGVEHFGRALARGFDAAVVVVDPTFNSVQVGVESARLAAPARDRHPAPCGEPGALGRRRLDRVARLRSSGSAAIPFTSVTAAALRRGRPSTCEPAVDRLLEGSALARRPSAASARPCSRGARWRNRDSAGCRPDARRSSSGRAPPGSPRPRPSAGSIPPGPWSRSRPSPIAPYSPPAMADHFLTGRDGPLYWKGEDVGRTPRDRRAPRHAGRRRSTPTTARSCWTVASGSATKASSSPRAAASTRRWRAPTSPACSTSSRSGRPPNWSAGSGGARCATALIVGNGFIGIELALAARRPRCRRHRHRAAQLGDAAGPRPGHLHGGRGGPRPARGVHAASRCRRPTPSSAPRGGRGPAGRRRRAPRRPRRGGHRGEAAHRVPRGLRASPTDWGVHVDDRLATSVPGVVAAGDVAEAADWVTGERYVHAIFPNAVSQAPIAAANLLGAELRYDGAEAMNSLKHLGVPIVAMGTIERSRRGAALAGRRRPALGLPPRRRDRGRAAGRGHRGRRRVPFAHAASARRSARFGRRLVEPGFGMADVVFDALGQGPQGNVRRLGDAGRPRSKRSHRRLRDRPGPRAPSRRVGQLRHAVGPAPGPWPRQSNTAGCSCSTRRPRRPRTHGLLCETPFVGPGMRDDPSLDYLPMRLSLVPRLFELDPPGRRRAAPHLGAARRQGVDGHRGQHPAGRRRAGAAPGAASWSPR